MTIAHSHIPCVFQGEYFRHLRHCKEAVEYPRFYIKSEEVYNSYTEKYRNHYIYEWFDFIGDSGYTIKLYIRDYNNCDYVYKMDLSLGSVSVNLEGKDDILEFISRELP